MPDQAQHNPFPGLRAFETDEEYLFFGREGQSQEILRRLHKNRFLAIIGTSGSGKSSLVRAGLLPYLYGGFMPGRGSHWRVGIFRPGSDPVGNLARTLNASSMLGPPDDQGDEAARSAILLEVTLRHSGLGLIEAVRLAALPPRENILIIIDQFEELFRFAGTGAAARYEDDANAFVKLLLEAVGQTELPIYISVTMRSEFIGDCARFRDLPEAVTRSPYLIPWMTREQRRRAIEEPVRVAQGKISQRVVARILNDGGENPDQLPIMQHALMRTWDYWQTHHQEGEEIDLNHYIEVGGVANALSRHADLTFDQLLGDHIKLVAKRIFQSLTERLSESRDVRRPLTIAKLMDETDCTFDEAVAVVEQFRQHGCSFLMPPPDIKLAPDTVIDISHESLIRGWRKLAEWVQEEHESAAFYRRLAEWAADHAKGKAALWQDPDLQTALDWKSAKKPNAAWAQRYHPGFDQAMAFLDQSCKAAQAAKEAEELRKAEEEKRQAATRQAEELRKAEEEKRKTKELRRARAHLKVVGLVCILALVALLGVIYFNAKYRKAREVADQQKNAIQAQKNHLEQEEEKWVESWRETLLQFYQMPDDPKASKALQQLRENILKEALTTSQRVWKDDPMNRNARMLETLSTSLLAKLHAEDAGEDQDKQHEVEEECKHNIETANKLRGQRQEHLDLVRSALLLGSSATILQKNPREREKAKGLALQAISDVQEASPFIDPNDVHLWNWALSSYTVARNILTADNDSNSDPTTSNYVKGSSNVEVRLLEKGMKVTSQAATGRSGVASKVAQADASLAVIKLQLLDTEREVATLEQEMKMPEEALHTYETGATLAKKLIDNSEASEHLVNSAFWVFAQLGIAYESKEKFDQALTALDEAKNIQERFASKNSQTQYDHLIIFSFLGTLHRDKSVKLEADNNAAHGELAAALAADKESLTTALALPFRLSERGYRLLLYFHENVMADYVRLKQYQEAEETFQDWLKTLGNPAGLDKSTSEYLINYGYSHIAHVFQNAGDYDESRKWIDRQIRSLGRGGISPSDRKGLLSGAYGQRSWVDLLAGDFDQAISDAQRGFKLDSSQVWIRTNEAHGFLFAGKFDQALQIYRVYWTKKTNLNGDEKFGEAVQNDFKEFRRKPNRKMNLDYLSKVEASIEGLKAQNKNGAH